MGLAHRAQNMSRECVSAQWNKRDRLVVAGFGSVEGRMAKTGFAQDSTITNFAVRVGTILMSGVEFGAMDWTFAVPQHQTCQPARHQAGVGET